MSGVLSVRHPVTSSWVDVATQLGGDPNGPTDLDGWWDGITLNRDVVALAGEHGVIGTDVFRGTPRVWPLGILLIGVTPGGAVTKIDGLKRVLPLGRIAEFKLGDVARVAYGRIDGGWKVRVLRSEPNDWSHGDRLLTIPVTFHDPALYDETATVTAVSANTAVSVALGHLPSRFTFEAPGAFSGITIQAFADDGTGLAPAATPYASMTLSTAPGSGDSLTIDAVNDVPILDDGGVLSNRWHEITAGWFFRLGQGLGEELVWFKSTRAGTLTHSRTW